MNTADLKLDRKQLLELFNGKNLTVNTETISGEAIQLYITIKSTSDLLKKLRAEDIKKYGKICTDEYCELHEKFCRCESYKKYKKKNGI